MLTAINWTKIDAHKNEFYKRNEPEILLDLEWKDEFFKFTADKTNYQDYLIVLSTGPYSAVESDLPDWNEKSRIIRKNHECTHYICRKLYPEKIDVIWDELIADAIGIYAAFGEYDTALARLFLGISDGKYTGGRLENYADEADNRSWPAQPDLLAAKCEQVISAIQLLFMKNKGTATFDMIPVLEDQKERILFFSHV